MTHLVKSMKYIPDLPAFMKICEQNFFRVMKLMPKREEVGDTSLIDVERFSYQLEITSTSRFTTDIIFKQTSSNIVGFINPELLVRIYHDARMAEVISPDYLKRIKPSNEYPNPLMHQKDEKYQVNAFLLDWLDHCITHGRANCLWDVNHGLV
ncbi:hypothetical protein SAMN02745724_00212 [Pseudoalteromonas denitrificans DSM 6059]|uniref:Dehydrogenase n=2 Tax=Pseudoalteromonas TaxID=53246 RepID=A0A1I1E4L0_9GAMM|nr:hypothetical protein SAMN02745724_00212 [Pseudoalteromonas denitrificans DSM 6059]